LNITGFSLLQLKNHSEFVEALDAEFKEIRRLLNHWDNEEDYTDEYLTRVTKEKAQTKKTLMVGFYINVGFQCIIYAITLFKLFSAL